MNINKLVTGTEYTIADMFGKMFKLTYNNYYVDKYGITLLFDNPDKEDDYDPEFIEISADEIKHIK